MKAPPKRRISLSVLLFGLVAASAIRLDAGVTLVDKGRAAAAVVTADAPSPVAAYAAQELVLHVKLATGVELPVARESDAPQAAGGRVFVGATRAAAARGLKTEGLDNDAFILRTMGGDLFILGMEDPEALPLDPEHGYSGTMFGVSEVLERSLGVRWLWPGKLGTYVPRTKSVTVADVDEVIAPRLLVREISYNLHQALSEFARGRPKQRAAQYREYPESQAKLGFSTPEALTGYVRDWEIFMRRHRLGCSQPLREEADYLRQNGIVDGGAVYRMPIPLHAFHGWWQRHGQAHPDWFAMRSDGTRGPKPGDSYSGKVAAMCVSNPDLHRFLVEEVMMPGRVYKVGPRTIWDGRAILDLSETDVGPDVVCCCSNCLAWDEPQPKGDAPGFERYKYKPRMVSNRYARFFKTVYDLAARKVPNVKVLGYLYHSSMPAPTIDIALNPNIVGEFIFYGGEAYFPMSDEVYAWYQEQWLGWRKTGMTLFLRSNHMLAGYVMPEICTWQIADFHKFLYQNGNRANTFESLECPWAAHGPMGYMQYRLFWNPELGAEELRREYFSAFGPAAALVERYFDYWESYARTRPPVSELIPAGMDLRLNAGEDSDGALEKLRRPLGAALAYPERVYPPAEAILEQALAAALDGGDLPEYAERVRFLQAGLEHARLSGRLHLALDYPDPAIPERSPRGVAPRDPLRLLQARRAMKTLLDFRRAHQIPYVADYVKAAQWDSHIENIRVLYPETDIGLSEPDPGFLSLRNAKMIALYDAGFASPAQNPNRQLWMGSVSDTGGLHDPVPGREEIAGKPWPYWKIANTGSAPNGWMARYSHHIGRGVLCNPDGWTVSATLRVSGASSDAGQATVTVRDGISLWQMSCVNNSTDGQFIGHASRTNALDKLADADLSSDYFTLQMVFDPVAQAVSFFRNGLKIGGPATRNDVPEETRADRLWVEWGDGDPSPRRFPTQTHWNRVKFEVGNRVGR